jgi:hypothetical protein
MHKKTVALVTPAIRKPLVVGSNPTWSTDALVTQWLEWWSYGAARSPFAQPLVLLCGALITVCVFICMMDVFVVLANVLQTKSGAVPKSSVDVSSGVFFLAIFFLFRILSSLVVQILKKPGY